MMKFSWLLLVLLLALAGCGRDAGHARTDLLKMNYAFTPDDFVRAARAGDEKAVRLFVKGGMNVNSEAASKETALIGAAENDVVPVLKFLLENSADANHKDAEGWTALMKAVYGGKQASVDVLAGANKDDLNSALLLASLLGHTEVVKILLQHGAEVDTAGDDGSTPLMYAAKSNNAELVKILMEANADPKMPDKTGTTAIDLAVAKGSADVLALLVPVTPLTPATPVTSTPTPATVVSSPTATPAESSASPSPSASPLAVASPVPPKEANLLKTSKDFIKPRATPRNSSEEAWWKKYGLDANAPGVIDADNDGDHFSNAEEFLSDTSPIDPSSHPAYATKMQWVGYHEQILPYLLVSVKDGVATLKAPDDSTIQVKQGDKAGDWQVALVSQASDLDKDGNPFDASKVILQNAAGEKLRLVPGIKSHGAGSYAQVHLPFLEDDLQLYSGQSFSLPGEPDRQYQVLDLRREQVVLKELNSGTTYTVGK